MTQSAQLFPSSLRAALYCTDVIKGPQVADLCIAVYMTTGMWKYEGFDLSEIEHKCVIVKNRLLYC